MRELVFRELYLKRKTYALSLLYSFIFSVMFHLILLSMNIGNIAKLSEGSLSYPKLYAYVLIILVPAFSFGTGLISDGGVTLGDESAHWNKFMRTVPISAFKKSAARYIVLLIEIAAAFMLSVGNAAIAYFSNDVGKWISNVGGSDLIFDVFFDISWLSRFSGALGFLAVIISFVTLINAIVIPLLYFFKARAAEYAWVVILLVAIQSAFKNKLENTPLSEAEDCFREIGRASVIAAPIVIIGSLAAGFLLTAAVLNRKER